MLATVDENTYTGGNTMALDRAHQRPPVVWCKDYQGGRSFYTALGNTADGFADAGLPQAPRRARSQWAAGQADPVYSDCGATVLANYQQTKISAPPNLNEPIGFDQLPDGRIIQTARAGQVRLHDPATQTTKRRSPTIPVYTNSEDGLYGPAVDNDFATNKWVYLYYAPPTVRIKKCDGTTADVDHADRLGADHRAPTRASGRTRGRATSSSRASSSSTVENPSLDLASEQKIIQVANNRGACCHVAGDIDFDKDNNLWFVTGDDTPAGGGNSGGFSPHNDMKTDETADRARQQRDGRHLHADLQRPDDGSDRRSTRPRPRSRRRSRRSSNIGRDDIARHRRRQSTPEPDRAFGGALAQQDVALLTGRRAAA